MFIGDISISHITSRVKQPSHLKHGNNRSKQRGILYTSLLFFLYRAFSDHRESLQMGACGAVVSWVPFMVIPSGLRRRMASFRSCEEEDMNIKVHLEARQRVTETKRATERVQAVGETPAHHH